MQSDNLNIFLGTVWSSLGKKKCFHSQRVSPSLSLSLKYGGKSVLQQSPGIEKGFPAVVAATCWSLEHSPLWTQLLNMLQDAPAAELAW